MNDGVNEDDYGRMVAVYEYLQLGMAPLAADCIVGFGNYNLDIPRRAAELYRQGLAHKVLFTGGFGRNTSGNFAESEAARFARAAVAAGVSAEDILIEDRATNTADNIVLARELLAVNGIVPKRVLGVHSSIMERRIWAAWQVMWPEVELVVTSPRVSFDEFLAHAERDGVTRLAAIEEMVGDLQRIRLYAERGWQVPQEVPEPVWQANEQLIAAGYGGQCVKVGSRQ